MGYLDFANPVPFADADGVLDLGLPNEAGRLSGRAQTAVRPISAADFNRIVGQALADREPLLPRIGEAGPAAGPGEDRAAFDYAQPRDRSFRRVVLRAYDERCAISGLKLTNGGGRAEVDAAHVRPVKEDGPDAVANGLPFFKR